MTVEEAIQQILHADYGEDVRNALASALDVINTDVENAIGAYHCTYNSTSFGDITEAVVDGYLPVCNYDNRFYTYCGTGHDSSKLRHVFVSVNKNFLLGGPAIFARFLICSVDNIESLDDEEPETTWSYSEHNVLDSANISNVYATSDEVSELIEKKGTLVKTTDDAQTSMSAVYKSLNNNGTAICQYGSGTSRTYLYLAGYTSSGSAMSAGESRYIFLGLNNTRSEILRIDLVESRTKSGSRITISYKWDIKTNTKLIPEPPSTAGTYVLKAVRTSSSLTYDWVADS